MTAPRPDTWMPLFIGDYLADTMHLTRDQHGAYLLLIMAYWRRGGPLPDDDGYLAATAKATPAEWRKLRPVLAEFFAVSDGKWVQKRCQEELDGATKITTERSNAGSKGAAKRWQREKQSDGKAIANAWQNDAPSPSPSPSPSPPAQLSSLDAARDPATAAIAAFDAARTGVFGPDQARPWPAPNDLATARRWLERGADLALVSSVCQAVMSRRKAQGKAPPDTLGYLDKPMADAIASGKAPMPEGQANGKEYPQLTEGQVYHGETITGPKPGQVVIGKNFDGKRIFGRPGEKPAFQPYIP